MPFKMGAETQGKMQPLWLEVRVSWFTPQMSLIFVFPITFLRGIPQSPI